MPGMHAQRIDEWIDLIFQSQGLPIMASGRLDWQCALRKMIEWREAQPDWKEKSPRDQIATLYAWRKTSVMMLQSAMRHIRKHEKVRKDERNSRT